MAVKNYLVEGVSCTGKTSVCGELQRRGYTAINGDTELAYQGDPETGEPTGVAAHAHHIWDVGRVKDLVASSSEDIAFFCGGSRNFAAFIGLFDAVFVLHVDADTLSRRLDARLPDEFGGQPAERELILRLHATQDDVPGDAIAIDATKPLKDVVEEILNYALNHLGH